MKKAEKEEPQYITDSHGKKLSVILPIEIYEKILEDLEELEDIKMYDAVKGRKEKTVPFKQYMEQRNGNKH